MRFLRLAGILVLATGAVSAAAAPPSQGELQRSADTLVAKSDLPAVIAVFEQDGVRHIAAAGLADVKQRRAARADRSHLGRQHHQVVRRSRRDAARRRGAAEPRRHRRTAPARLGSPGPARSDPQPPQPHERHPELHGVRARTERRVSQPADGDPGPQAHRARAEVQPRLQARQPRGVLEHELRPPRRDRPARHQAAARPRPPGADLRARSVSARRPTSRAPAGSTRTSCTATRSAERALATSRGTPSAVSSPTARSSPARATSPCSSAR